MKNTYLLHSGLVNIHEERYLVIYLERATLTLLWPVDLNVWTHNVQVIFSDNRNEPISQPSLHVEVLTALVTNARRN